MHVRCLMPKAINLAEAAGLGDDLDEPDLKEMLTYEKQTPHLEGSGWGAFFDLILDNAIYLVI